MSMICGSSCTFIKDKSFHRLRVPWLTGSKYFWTAMQMGWNLPGRKHGRQH